MLPAIGSMISAAIVSPSRCEQFAGGIEIVVGKGQREVGQFFRHTGRIRLPESQCARAGLDQERIAVPVITAFKLDDARPSGCTAREADG